MKPIYKSLVLANMALAVTLSLQANVTSDGESTPQAVNAETLEGLKVTLVSPNVSGARDLIANGECVISDNELQISLDGSKLAQGTTYRILVQMEYGTNTVVLYALNVTVPRYVTLASGTQEYADNVVVVSTFGDGDNSGADASVYAKNGEGNAHITKPLSVGYGVASNDGSVASGYVNGDGSYISASGDGSVASGYAGRESSHISAGGDGSVASGYVNGDGSYIEASGDGSVASGYTDGENSYIAASGDGSVASGYAGGENSYIAASNYGSVASGYAGGENSYIEASNNGSVASGYAGGESSHISAGGDGSVASGYTDGVSGNVEAKGVGSQAFGIGVQAIQNGQIVCGKCNVVDEDDTFQMIVGNGADDEHRSNAFGVTKSGSLALFKADGTPIYLDAAKLEALIAMLPNA